MKIRWVTCNRGHRFKKSSLCPVCPICWPGRYQKIKGDFPEDLSAPALRALDNAQIKSLKALSQYSEKEILALHGMGPASLPKLRRALKAKKLTFKKK